MLNLAGLVPPFCLYSPNVLLANKLPAGICLARKGGEKEDKLLILSGRRYGKKVNSQFLMATVPSPNLKCEDEALPNQEAKRHRVM